MAERELRLRVPADVEPVGSSHTSGSRFAEAPVSRTASPERMVIPPMYGELPKTSTGKVQKNVLRDRIAG